MEPSTPIKNLFFTREDKDPQNNDLKHTTILFQPKNRPFSQLKLRIIWFRSNTLLLKQKAEATKAENNPS